MQAPTPRKSSRKLKPTEKAKASKKSAPSDEDYQDEELEELAKELRQDEEEFAKDSADEKPKPKAKRAMKAAVAKDPPKPKKAAPPPKVSGNSPAANNNSAATTTVQAWTPIETSLLLLLAMGGDGIDTTERGGVAGIVVSPFYLFIMYWSYCVTPQSYF